MKYDFIFIETYCPNTGTVYQVWLIKAKISVPPRVAFC